MKSMVSQMEHVINKTGVSAKFVRKEKQLCPGAWNMGAYDRLQDIDYHTLNPTEPQCSNGYLINSEAEEIVKVIWIDGLEQGAKNISRAIIVLNYVDTMFGELNIGQKVIFFSSKINADNIDYIEFDGVKYTVENKKKKYDNGQHTLTFLLLRQGDNV